MVEELEGKKGEPMSDLISRSEVWKEFISRVDSICDLVDVREILDSISTAEPKVGKWERKPYKRQGHEEVVIEGYSWRCSNCGDARKRNEPGMKFCPNCGAKMERSE